MQKYNIFKTTTFIEKKQAELWVHSQVTDAFNVSQEYGCFLWPWFNVVKEHPHKNLTRWDDNVTTSYLLAHLIRYFFQAVLYINGWEKGKRANARRKVIPSRFSSYWVNYQVLSWSLTLKSYFCCFLYFADSLTH